MPVAQSPTQVKSTNKRRLKRPLDRPSDFRTPPARPGPASSVLPCLPRARFTPDNVCLPTAECRTDQAIDDDGDGDDGYQINLDWRLQRPRRPTDCNTAPEDITVSQTPARRTDHRHSDNCTKAKRSSLNAPGSHTPWWHSISCSRCFLPISPHIIKKWLEKGNAATTNAQMVNKKNIFGAKLV